MEASGLWRSLFALTGWLQMAARSRCAVTAQEALTRQSGAVCFRRLDRVSDVKRNRHVQTTLTTFVRIGCSRGEWCSRGKWCSRSRWCYRTIPARSGWTVYVDTSSRKKTRTTGLVASVGGSEPGSGCAWNEAASFPPHATGGSNGAALNGVHPARGAVGRARRGGGWGREPFRPPQGARCARERELKSGRCQQT